VEEEIEDTEKPLVTTAAKGTASKIRDDLT